MLSGANVNWKYKVFIYAPLHEMCHNGSDPKVVTTLLAAGVDVNATTFELTF